MAPIPRASSHSIVALDLLRGLAAFTVLLVHTRGGAFVEFGALPVAQQNIAMMVFFGLTRLGQEPVLVFFVLSGFLVGGQIIRHTTRGVFNLKTYVIDRCTRIFVPLIPACVLSAVLAYTVMGQSPGALVIVAHMTGLNDLLAPTFGNNLPLWSLSYEIWFYIVGGAVGCLAVRKHLSVSMVVLAICAVIFSMLGARFLIYWAFGAAATLLIASKGNWRLFAVGVPLTLVGIAAVQLAVGSRSLERYGVSLGVAEAMLCGGIALALPFLNTDAVNNALAFVRAPAAGLAAFSYSLYLTHYPVVSALNTVLPQAKSIDGHSLGLFLFKVLACLVFAFAFYWCFEQNTARLRAYLSNK